MGDHDHGDVLLAPDARQFLLHADLGHGVERAQRLVEQQDLGLHGERPRNADALRHAAGKLARPGIGEFGEADERDVETRPLLGLLPGHAAHFEAEGDVAEHGQPGQQARLLEDHGALGTDAVDRLAVDCDAAAVGGLQPGKDAQQRGLARAAGADDD
ncbi:hypothetical protein AJ88_40755 [Mesorhizobium amorphae CCBAU 01583]|nr:hypothetical protein AJ88_40755 [Mesorhizobium amorphae CCBAU 01583]